MRHALPRFDRRVSSWLIIGIVIVLGCIIALSSAGPAIDRSLMELRFAAVDRVASGRVAIVEMDAASIAKIRRWPWSRSHYADVVDHLRAAGAASIVFDVDFSASADAPGDRAFAAALARAEGLTALPTFSQAAGSNDQRGIDSLPLAMFRPHVALASVSIRPDPDGQVRSMPFGTMTDGTPRPSLSAYIAARSGAVDTEFPIDMSIDPGSIPRLSFVAVRDNRFDPATVRGRHILIGATAIEMGDRYGTPQWGVVPGVTVQALAAETLMRGVPLQGSPWIAVLLATLALTAFVFFRSLVSSVAVAVVTGTALVVGALVAQHRFLVIYPLAAALVMIVLAALACVIRDVFGRFRQQRLTDDDTGLPNARALLQAVGDLPISLVTVQIDNYDALRAVLGNRVAADVVIRASERLALIGQSGTVYRTADHQLTFLLPADRAADDLFNGLRALLLQPIEVAGRRVDMAVSVGIASGERVEGERLLTEATLAAEQARSDGTFWSRADADIDGLDRSLSLMGELDDAIASGHIEVFYQPKYHLREHRIVSVEALVRWRHPTRGFIGPDIFIPAAEKTNRIAPLTLYVINRVVRDLVDWRAQSTDLTAAINISAKLLSAADFNAEVEQILWAADVPSSSLIFEVTESAAMSNTEAAVAALHRYRELGVAISMDDYGTGQSTLTYLRQLPLGELKIDRSFVQFAHQNPDDAVLVRSTIELAHQLGLKVVAEGVEAPECLAFLASAGCDVIQGYLISRPLPRVEITTMILANYRYAA